MIGHQPLKCKNLINGRKKNTPMTLIGLSLTVEHKNWNARRKKESKNNTKSNFDEKPKMQKNHTKMLKSASVSEKQKTWHRILFYYLTKYAYVRRYMLKFININTYVILYLIEHWTAKLMLKSLRSYASVPVPAPLEFSAVYIMSLTRWMRFSSIWRARCSLSSP